MPSDLDDVRQKIDTKYQAIQDQDHYELLDVGQDASREEIARQFRQLAKKWHADRFKGQDIGQEHRQKVQAIFTEINNAHRTLSNPDKREEYDASLEGEETDLESVFDAESAFRRGKNMLNNGSIKGARQQFKRAVEQSPEDEPDYRGHMLYTEYMSLPKDDKGRPKAASAKERAREIFDELDAIADDNSNRKAWVYAFMGHVAQGLDRTNQAESLFREAKQLDPDNRLAQRQLRLLKMRKQKDDKQGFFSKLFSKLTS